MENQQLVMDQILDKDPTEIFYTERTVLEKMLTRITIGHLN